MSVVTDRHAGPAGLSDAWVAYQKQPFSASLLQASLQGVFRRSPPVAPLVQGRRADDLVDDLIRLALNHQAVQHPYLQALGSGNLPDLPFALRDFARHYRGYLSHGSRFLVALNNRLSDSGHRAALQPRLAAEWGPLRPEQRQALLLHGLSAAWLDGLSRHDLFEHFRQAVGVATPQRGDEPTALEVICWREQVLSLLEGGSLAEAVGALLLGTEVIESTVAQPFLEAIERVGLDPRASAYFLIQAEDAEPLLAPLRRIARDLAGTIQGQRDLAKGMHKALVLRSAFWAWLHQRALSLTAMQT